MTMAVSFTTVLEFFSLHLQNDRKNKDDDTCLILLMCLCGCIFGIIAFIFLCKYVESVWKVNIYCLFYLKINVQCLQ